MSQGTLFGGLVSTHGGTCQCVYGFEEYNLCAFSADFIFVHVVLLWPPADTR